MTSSRERLALALDVPDLGEALELARRLDPWFGVAKVGLELHAAAGREAVERLHDLGWRVFLDVKLHDIPTTVGRACRILGGLGVGYVTVHCAGGVEMLRAAVEGLGEGAAAAGCDPALALGVTVLTSEPDAAVFPARLAAAVEAGCGGVVCSADEVGSLRAAHPGLVTVVPGIRLEGGPAHDQARVGDPATVARLGADLLVVGRAVTAAADPAGTAARIAAAVEGAA
ncbi:MAG: orotidine-5'-phosphate decarboxylase [Acidimicrobiia bacterium]|nr:orotidine-5'-phosphate decarboxylase [Acidimicrobiia bacterium]